MKETMGLGNTAWLNLVLNSALFAFNMWMYSLNPMLVSAMGAGFHIGLMFAAIAMDRIFLAPMRRDIRALQAYLNQKQER